MTKLTNVKWAGPNTPYIRLTNSQRQLILSKSELKELRDQIDVFMDFYKQDFEQPNIEWVDYEDGEEAWHPYAGAKDVKRQD